MSVLETCAVAVAISSVTIACTSVAGLASLWRIRRRMEAMTAHANQTLTRLNEVAGNFDAMVRSARRIETRLHRTVDVLLDGIEPLLVVVSTVIAAGRAGMASWMQSGADGARGGERSRAATGPQKGEGHERNDQR